MHIIKKSQDRAILLLQIGRELPEFEAQATYLAERLLVAAAVRFNSGRIERTEEEARAN